MGCGQRHKAGRGPPARPKKWSIFHIFQWASGRSLGSAGLRRTAASDKYIAPDRTQAKMAPKLSKILYLPMEIASRELDLRLLLATIAASHGFEIVLGQKWLIERNIERMTPGVYLSKTLTVRDAKMLSRAKEAGYITAAIDEEIPGLYVHDKKFWWVSARAVEATDLIFLPGSFNSQGFTESFGLASGRVRAGRQSALGPAAQGAAVGVRAEAGGYPPSVRQFHPGQFQSRLHQLPQGQRGRDAPVDHRPGQDRPERHRAHGAVQRFRGDGARQPRGADRLATQACAGVPASPHHPAPAPERGDGDVAALDRGFSEPLDRARGRRRFRGSWRRRC